MVNVGSRLIVLEGVVMAVVSGGTGSDRLIVGGLREVGVEPAPGDSLGVQQVADVLAGHLHRRVARRGYAVIESGFHVCNHGPIGDLAANTGDAGLMRLAGDEIEVTHHGSPEFRI